MKSPFLFNALLAVAIGGTAAVWDAVHRDGQIMHWLRKTAQEDRLLPRSPHVPVPQPSQKAVVNRPSPKPAVTSPTTGKRGNPAKPAGVVERASVVDSPKPMALGGVEVFNGAAQVPQPVVRRTSVLAPAERANPGRYVESHGLLGAEMPADFTIPQPPIVLLKKAQPKRNHVSLSYNLALNITADFKNIGNFPAAGGGPGEAIAGVNHNYDDGYNRVDVTGNDHGLFFGSWNWGYQNPGQISGDSLVMRSASLAGTVGANNSGDPQHGFELRYGRELGRADKWRGGVEGAFGFTDVRIQDNRPLAANVSVIRDTYALNGIIPPVAPYSGTFNGPGAIIVDAPERGTETLTGGATINGWRRLDADLFAFKVGPYIEVPLSRRWTLDFRGGLAVVLVNSEFSYEETTTISGLGEHTSSAHGSGSDLLVGAYAGGDVSYSFSQAFAAFAGAQYQNVGEYSQNLNGRKAVLDLSKSIFVTIGLSYSY